MTGTNRCHWCDSRLASGEGLDSKFSHVDGQVCRECVAAPRIALVGCGSSKIALDDGETVAAKDLYDSPYFSLKREFAETCCDKWMILSAEHGLISPDEEIGAYDASLKPSSNSYIGDYEAGKWSVNTSNEIRVFDSFQAVYASYVVLAGEDYVRHIEDELASGHRRVSFPFRSDDLGGIGDQQGWLREQIDSYHPPDRADLDHYGAVGGESA
ncbi:DUF6884 domain-containing protein [Haloarcula sp. CBA1127]|uniref:DUF6884 domain-containing protein n=1 Tax=Haloarcula sp. CBA1127 TaxID=1765055 RepID=UPI00073F279F|nr:DUF6884 domain-containing protein [Haloarcula sp. CBA1127]